MVKNEANKVKTEPERQAWYERLYQDFDDYDEEPYTQQTGAEVDFIETTIDHDRDLRVLDVGCGTGRHSLELARRGYRHVTGIDLSASMVKQAKAKARAEELPVTFLRQDARRLQYEAEFDIVLMLCEGGFSLMETDAMDRQILRGVARALQPGGKLLMTAPNAAFMLARFEEVEGFDPVSLREQFTLERNDERLACTQRYYTVPELKWLLRAEGLGDVVAFAVGERGYRQDRAPLPGDYELGIFAVKRHSAGEGGNDGIPL